MHPEGEQCKTGFPELSIKDNHNQNNHCKLKMMEENQKKMTHHLSKLLICAEENIS